MHSHVLVTVLGIVVEQVVVRDDCDHRALQWAGIAVEEGQGNQPQAAAHGLGAYDLDEFPSLSAGMGFATLLPVEEGPPDPIEVVECHVAGEEPAEEFPGDRQYAADVAPEGQAVLRSGCEQDHTTEELGIVARETAEWNATHGVGDSDHTLGDAFVAELLLARVDHLADSGTLVAHDDHAVVAVREEFDHELEPELNDSAAPGAREKNNSLLLHLWLLLVHPWTCQLGRHALSRSRVLHHD